MAGELTELQEELMGLMAQAWPKFIAPGQGYRSNFYTDIQAARLNIVEMAKNPATPPPYYGGVFGTFSAETDFGMDNDLQRAPFFAFVIDDLARGASQETVTSDLYYFKRLIDGGAGFSTFLPIEYGNIDASLSNKINSDLVSDARTGLIGGHVFWTPGLLVGSINRES